MQVYRLFQRKYIPDDKINEALPYGIIESFNDEIRAYSYKVVCEMCAICTAVCTMGYVKSLSSVPIQKKQNVRTVSVSTRPIQNTKKDTVFLDKWVCMIAVMFIQ